MKICPSPGVCTLVAGRGIRVRNRKENGAPSVGRYLLQLSSQLGKNDTFFFSGFGVERGRPLTQLRWSADRQAGVFICVGRRIVRANHPSFREKKVRRPGGVYARGEKGSGWEATAVLESRGPSR